MMVRDAVPTDWVISNLSSEYKLIFVGDAQMAPDELFGWDYSYSIRRKKWERPAKPKCGFDWLMELKSHFRHNIWLNPSDKPTWGDYWSMTYDTIEDNFPMFPLTVEGMEDGMKKLLAR